MEQMIFENDFLTINLNSKKSLITSIYKADVDYLNLTQEIYEEYMMIFAEQIQSFQITKSLSDSRFSEVMITPDMHKWTAKVIAPLTLSLKKVAFVVSKDIITNLSRTIMMEEDGLKDLYEVAYFDTLAEAEEWLEIS